MPRYIHGMSRPRHFDAIIIGAGAAGSSAPRARASVGAAWR
jgi:tRNA U34 5-carboxymethylaminomethyl modifying enzyme MnmG/GidA